MMCKMRTRVFRKFIDILDMMVTRDAVLRFRQHGLYSIMTDDKKTRLVHLRIGAHACMEYDVDGCYDVVVNVSWLGHVLQRFHDGIIELAVENDSLRIKHDDGEYNEEYTHHVIKPYCSLEEPKVPSPDRVKVVMSARPLRRMMEAARYWHIVRLMVNSGGVHMHCEDEDMVDAHATSVLNIDDLATVDVESSIMGDYLFDGLDMFNPDDIVTMYVGKDLPITMTTTNRDALYIEYVIAPCRTNEKCLAGGVNE